MDDENLENYEDIVMATNENIFDTKSSIKLIEKKSIPTKEKDSKNPKSNSNHNLKDLSTKKENKEKNSIKNKPNERKKPELSEDESDEIKNEDNKESDPYNKITIRNLNKYFDESDFHYENNEFYQRYIIHKRNYYFFF